MDKIVYHSDLRSINFQSIDSIIDDIKRKEFPLTILKISNKNSNAFLNYLSDEVFIIDSAFNNYKILNINDELIEHIYVKMLNSPEQYEYYQNEKMRSFAPKITAVDGVYPNNEYMLVLKYKQIDDHNIFYRKLLFWITVVNDTINKITYIDKNTLPDNIGYFESIAFKYNNALYIGASNRTESQASILSKFEIVDNIYKFSKSIPITYPDLLADYDFGTNYFNICFSNGYVISSIPNSVFEISTRKKYHIPNFNDYIKLNKNAVKDTTNLNFYVYDFKAFQEHFYFYYSLNDKYYLAKLNKGESEFEFIKELDCISKKYNGCYLCEKEGEYLKFDIHQNWFVREKI